MSKKICSDDYAEWIRVDLHLHSPGVGSFKLSDSGNIQSMEFKKKIIDEYLNQLQETNIKIGAITDYNGIREDWFYLISSESERRGITIFPGTELYILGVGGKYGIHILIILDRDIDIEGFNRFLHSLDKNPQKPLLNGRENREIEASKDLEELINEIRKKYDCLIIFAHPEDDKGILKTFKPKEAARYIARIRPDAMEYFSEDWKSKLVNTNEITSELLSRIAKIENSDPKEISEIGTKKRNTKLRATYIKLSDLSLEALRIALHDPEVRVKLYEKPRMLHNQITKINIKGTTFLKNTALSFSPELNTFIGGRGVGKSAILEAIRYCMELPYYTEDKLQKIDFVSAVVGSGGEINIHIDKFYGEKKTSYIIKRIFGKESEVYDEDGNKLSLKTSDIFEKEKTPILIGQKELYFISQNEKFLLEIIDQIIGKKIEEKQFEFNKMINQLRDNANKIIDVEKKLTKKEDLEQELKIIESKISEYEKLGVLEKLEKYTKTLADDEKLKFSLRKFDKIIEDLENSLKEASEVLSGIITTLRDSKSYRRHILFELSSVFERVKRNLEDLKLIQELKSIHHKEITQIVKKWNDEREKVEKEVDEIKRRLGEEKLEPEKLEQLTKRRAHIESILKDFKKYDEELRNLLNLRSKLKERLKSIRHELFRIREEEISKINAVLKNRLKIKVIFEGNRKYFKSAFTNLLTASGIQKDAISEIVDNENITIDGIFISDIINEGILKIREKFNLTEKMAERLLKHFQDKNKLFELETLFPDDMIIIELNVDGNFLPLNKLSPGQRATALLLLLFILKENTILILDQPEEDLDNRFIFEDVVKILRELKGKRQIIMATHNANIPVLGDSELIVVLDKKGDHCVISDCGSIDKESIRENVKKIMEGGEEAFRRRAEKYGGI